VIVRDPAATPAPVVHAWTEFFSSQLGVPFGWISVSGLALTSSLVFPHPQKVGAVAHDHRRRDRYCRCPKVMNTGDNHEIREGPPSRESSRCGEVEFRESRSYRSGSGEHPKMVHQKAEQQANFGLHN
jgi:hypothetical protein